MPLLQDQFQAAERLEYMGLGSSGIESKILFPHKMIKADITLKRKYVEVKDDQKRLKTKCSGEAGNLKLNHGGSISSRQDLPGDNNNGNRNNNNNNNNNNNKNENNNKNNNNNENNNNNDSKNDNKNENNNNNDSKNDNDNNNRNKIDVDKKKRRREIHRTDSSCGINSVSCYESNSDNDPFSPSGDFFCSDSTFNSDYAVDYVSDIKEMERLVDFAVIHLEKRLRFVKNPLHRLRCGCYGKDLRDDVKENGLKNAANVVMNVLKKGNPRIEEEKKERERERERENEREIQKEREWEIDRRICPKCTVTSDEINDNCFYKDVKRREELKIEMIYDNEQNMGDRSAVKWHMFDCGVNIAVHHTAPEESQFLYEEIFLSRIYLQHGVVISEGDLIIDVGE